MVRLFGKVSAHCCETESDKDTIEQAIKVIPKCDLTFLQLHDIEVFIKSADKNDTGKQLKVANRLDANVLKLVEQVALWCSLSAEAVTYPK